jgi:hypothetical protein
MIGIPWLIVWAWQSETGRIILFVIGGLLAVDLGLVPALRGYRNFLRSQPPRDAELSKASHGAAVLAVVALALWFVGWPRIDAFLTAFRAAPDSPLHLAVVAGVAGVVLWGVLWLVTGARRSLQFAGRDSRVITRAALKISVGVGVWMIWNNPPASWWPWVVLLHEVPYSAAVVAVLCGWLAVTGAAKMLLVALPAAGNALRIVTRHRQRNNGPMIAAGGRRSRARLWPMVGALALAAVWFLW